jgi:hypothetical protein
MQHLFFFGFWFLTLSLPILNSAAGQVVGPPVVTTTGGNFTPDFEGLGLAGTVQPNGGKTWTYFEYVADGGAANVFQTMTTDIPASSDTFQVATSVTGLPLHSLYHYRIVAFNSGPIYYGQWLAGRVDDPAPSALLPVPIFDVWVNRTQTITLPFPAASIYRDPVSLVSASSSTTRVKVISVAGNQVTCAVYSGQVGNPGSLTFVISDGTVSATGTVPIVIHDYPDTQIIPGVPTLTSSRSAAFTFTPALQGASVTQYQSGLDGEPTVTSGPSRSFTNLADGSHTLTVASINTVGDIDPTPAVFTWTVDTTPPVLDLPGDLVFEAAGPGGTIVNYQASAEDAISGVASASFKPASGSRFPLGTTTVSATAVDKLKNSVTGGFRVTVRDSTPPVIFVAGENPATVPFGSTYRDAGATAYDAVDGRCPVTASGSVDTAIPGTYLIAYQSADKSLNSAVLTRTVNVTPAIKPTATDDLYFLTNRAGRPASLPVLENDLDQDTSSLTIVVLTQPRSGRAAIARGGQEIVFTPRYSFADTAIEDSFTYTILDGAGARATGTVHLRSGALGVQGIYDGFVTEGAATVGRLRVALAAGGALSGRLELGFHRYTFTGRIGLEGGATVHLGTLPVTLQFPVDGSGNLSVKWREQTAVFTGTLTHETYQAVKHPAPQAGRYQANLGADPTPSGIAGRAALRVSLAGAVSFSGTLADGSKFTGDGLLKEDGSVALYTLTSLRGGMEGILSGTLHFRRLLPSDCDAALDLLEADRHSAAVYVKQSETTLTLTGLRN